MFGVIVVVVVVVVVSGWIVWRIISRRVSGIS